jgi:hypothetical protein
MGGEREEAVRLLQEILEPLSYNLKKPSQKESLLKKLPFISRLIKSTGGLGGSALQFGSSVSFLQSSGSTSLAAGFNWASLGFAIFDFILIPLIYLSAFILKEPVPFKLSTNAKWLYAALVLGLSIAALALPAIASILGLVIGSLVLSVSVFLLAKTLVKRDALSKELKSLEQEISTEEQEMADIQDKGYLLQGELQKAQTNEEVQALKQKIIQLHQLFLFTKEKVQTLKERELAVTEKIKHLGAIHIVDRVVGITFTAGAVTGLALSLVFPYIGLTIVAAVSIASFTYLLGRAAMSLAKWVKNKWEASESLGAREVSDKSYEPQFEKRFKHEDKLEATSTSSILEHLKDKEADSKTADSEVISDTSFQEKKEKDSETEGEEIKDEDSNLNSLH